MRSPTPALDPALDAAILLRRIGFATLLVAVPITALVARRAAVVLVPIGIILMVLAALMDGANGGFNRSLRRTFVSPAGLAALLLIGWAALSIAWAPQANTALDKLLNALGAAAMAFAGIAALPERMRASNLYLTGIGAAAASIFAILVALGLLGRDTIDPGSLERGLVTLSVLLWPAIGWLISRGHGLVALALGAVAGLAVVGGGSFIPLLALAAGATMFALTSWRPPVGRDVLRVAVAAVILAAPLLPFLLRPLAKALMGTASPAVQSIRVWADIVRSDPLRLITGHGLAASLRGRLVGLVPREAPLSLPFEIWYDLGVVGAATLAVLLYFAIRAAGGMTASLVPAAIATFTVAFVVAASGMATTQAWWLTLIGIAVIAFLAIERGQFRTTRPKARLFGRLGKP
ncbi:hypothetical protein [Chelatococcus sp. GW1]|uniref:hypothetical protein n=1 Tax=Chelatococcus sp. GW1 TaxID=1211115 RepID=UPI0003196BA7|nr:hypothetical protein [Chelatococcus sp. GW1]